MSTRKYECDKCERTFKTEEACEVHEEHCNDKEHEEKKQEKKKSGGGALILIIIILLIWGFVGGVVAQDVGVSCDMGIGETFCWIWHTNYAGQITEGFNDLFRG
ncbi:MAG: hypothetical protein AABW89_05685 [Nanoarchaeota archaeon]